MAMVCQFTLSTSTTLRDPPSPRLGLPLLSRPTRNLFKRFTNLHSDPLILPNHHGMPLNPCAQSHRHCLLPYNLPPVLHQPLSLVSSQDHSTSLNPHPSKTLHLLHRTNRPIRFATNPPPCPTTAPYPASRLKLPLISRERSPFPHSLRNVHPIFALRASSNVD